MIGQPVPLQFIPGINPEPDETKQNTVHCIDANNIRFYRGQPQTIGGHVAVMTDNTLAGVTRSEYSYVKNNQKFAILGTSSGLYAQSGNFLYNITPTQATGTTLGANPIATTNGSRTVVVSQTGHGFVVGQRIRLAGATATGGLAATDINGDRIITAVSTNAWSFLQGTPATSTTTGGGSAVISYPPILSGQVDAAAVEGPGIGLPGAGLPGSVGTDPTLFKQPRVWSFVTFGSDLIVAPGQGGRVYRWQGDVAAGPTDLTQAPNADWIFLDSAKLGVWLGNAQYNSETGDLTQWTASSTNAAFMTTRFDAVKIFSEISFNGVHLAFDEANRIFGLQYIGGTSKWNWQKVSDNIGLIAPNARCVVQGIVYIFGKDNLYRYNGGIFEPLPDNTLRRWIYDRINRQQQWKCHLWFNEAFGELWFHFPVSNEPDNVAIYSITEGHFTTRTSLLRSASQQEGQVYSKPILVSPDGTIWQHEVGFNNGSSSMPVYVRTAYAAGNNGANLTAFDGMEPDGLITGNMTFKLYGKDRAQSVEETQLVSLPANDDTPILWFQRRARYRAWEASQNELNGFFRLGALKEYIRPTSRN